MLLYLALLVWLVILFILFILIILPTSLAILILVLPLSTLSFGDPPIFFTAFNYNTPGQATNRFYFLPPPLKGGLCILKVQYKKFTWSSIVSTFILIKSIELLIQLYFYNDNRGILKLIIKVMATSQSQSSNPGK